MLTGVGPGAQRTKVCAATFFERPTIDETLREQVHAGWRDDTVAGLCGYPGRDSYDDSGHVRGV